MGEHRSPQQHADNSRQRANDSARAERRDETKKMSTNQSAENTGLLWLELKFENMTRVFEFGPDDDRVVAVGSLLRADVRFDRAGVAPVHFQLERVANAVLLSPVYGRDLRLNGENV